MTCHYFEKKIIFLQRKVAYNVNNINSRTAKKRRATKRAKLVKPSNLTSKVERVLELPPGALSGAAHIEFTGNYRAILDGNCGILEYDGDVIRLSTGSGVIRFTGSDLVMTALTDENAVVEGKILSVEFLG